MTAFENLGLNKAKTGIYGLDDLTVGGLARGRTTLLCGGPGTGKTVLAAQFLVNGATEFGEPGVFLPFEEGEGSLAANMAGFGWDLPALEAQGMLTVDRVSVAPDLQEVGDWDLDGLLLRIRHAVEKTGARRLVLDTIEVLFSALPDRKKLRRSLRSLFEAVGEMGLATIVTAERGDGSLTRFGLEEYVSDCVILLDQRVTEQLATRRLHILKYRGSPHGLDEFPFLIDEEAVSVLPGTALRFENEASAERVSSGLAHLDEMLAGGYFVGSTVMVSGTPGSGKSTIAAAFAAAASSRGERVLYLSLEESPSQIVRNMKSVGIDLRPHVAAGTLTMMSSRPTAFGLETHLTHMRREIDRVGPVHVVVDPVSDFRGDAKSIEGMLSRLLDQIKNQGLTALMTSLIPRDQPRSAVGISSVVDTWIMLKNDARRGGHRRTLEIIKSRGMAHSDELRELRLTGDGPLIGGAVLDTGPANE